jgi:hypothetical protein
VVNLHWVEHAEVLRIPSVVEETTLEGSGGDSDAGESIQILVELVWFHPFRPFVEELLIDAVLVLVFVVGGLSFWVESGL